MSQLVCAVLLLAFTSFAAAQGGLTYDQFNHFIYPPTPVDADDFAAAVNITKGQVTFTWVTNLATTGLSIYQEGNDYYPVLIGPYAGDNYTWNGSLSLGPDGTAWPSFNSYGNTFFLGVTDPDSNDTSPIFYSRYFRLVDASSSATTSTSSSSETSEASTVSPTGDPTSVASGSSAATSSGSGLGLSSSSGSITTTSSKYAVVIGAGVGVGVGIPLLIGGGVIIWLLTRKRKQPSAKTVPQYQPLMAQEPEPKHQLLMVQQPEPTHQLHGDSKYPMKYSQLPIELESPASEPPRYR